MKRKKVSIFESRSLNEHAFNIARGGIGCVIHKFNFHKHMGRAITINVAATGRIFRIYNRQDFTLVDLRDQFDSIFLYIKWENFDKRTLEKLGAIKAGDFIDVVGDTCLLKGQLAIYVSAFKLWYGHNFNQTEKLK